MIKKNTFYIHTLGCAKNEFDSLRVAKKLVSSGFKKTSKIEEAEYIILNTCSFIEDAVVETFETAGKIRSLLKKGQKFVFAGCAVNYFREKITEAVDADLYLSTSDLQLIENYIGKRGVYLSLKNEDIQNARDYESLQEGEVYAYLKVAEGCSNRCSYCLIPTIRGGLKSVRKEIVIEEAVRLANSNVKELNIIAQDLSSYGKDLGMEKGLYELLSEMCEALENFKLWIRLLYVNPDKVDFSLLEEIFRLKNVVPYLEMPVQSGSNRILRLMNRKRKAEEILERVSLLRRKVPGLTVRTTLLAGFPSETEDDFRETVEFLQALRPDYCYIFAYSDMEGTQSFKMEGKLEEKIIVDRANILSEIAFKIMEEKASEKEGMEVEVLVENAKAGNATGRAIFQAPEIDGKTFIRGNVRKGDFVKVKIERSSGIDFEGRVVGIESF